MSKAVEAATATPCNPFKRSGRMILGSHPIEPQAREVEFLNKGVDRPNRIALIDPVLQALGKQRPLPAIDPLNEAPHLPPQIAAESYSANQILQCVFTQPRSGSTKLTPSIRRPLLGR
jgi:hypothetical protein